VWWNDEGISSLWSGNVLPDHVRAGHALHIGNRHLLEFSIIQIWSAPYLQDCSHTRRRILIGQRSNEHAKRLKDAGEWVVHKIVSWGRVPKPSMKKSRPGHQQYIASKLQVKINSNADAVIIIIIIITAIATATAPVSRLWRHSSILDQRCGTWSCPVLRQGKQEKNEMDTERYVITFPPVRAFATNTAAGQAGGKQWEGKGRRRKLKQRKWN
jgi:hypothetical protein